MLFLSFVLIVFVLLFLECKFFKIVLPKKILYGLTFFNVLILFLLQKRPNIRIFISRDCDDFNGFETLR